MQSAVELELGSEAITTTRDYLLGGSIQLWQPTRGYRVNIDPILLAHFAGARAKYRFAIDLGAGVGAIALCLHHLCNVDSVALVEREPVLANLARRNLSEARLPGSVHVLDLEAEPLPAALCRRADLVVANPPFFSPDSGRPAVERLTCAARSGSIEPFLSAAASALSSPKARAMFAYPARSLQPFLMQAADHGLFAKRLRLVHAQIQSPARIALIELRRARPGGLDVLPPLVEWREPGIRSSELKALLKG